MGKNIQTVISESSRYGNRIYNSAAHRSLLELLLMLLGLASVLLAFALTGSAKEGSCTLSNSGGDDAPALLAAVAACSVVSIPAETTLNISTRLDMTGLQDFHIDLQGTIAFYPDIPYWSGNSFTFAYQNSSTGFILGGENVLLSGGGTLDGSGQEWYDAQQVNFRFLRETTEQRMLSAANASLVRPILLTVYQGNNITVENIAMLNSPNWVNLIYESTDVIYSNITITAASGSSNAAHNTDGWDTYRSDNIVIKDSVIRNTDDCVSFKPNSTNILVSNLDCWGSHGISVGSLGQYAGQYDIVENVTATDIRMTNAGNGARIKVWAGPNVGSGIVRNITYKNWIMSDVVLPLTIDQCYFSEDSCAEFPSNTYIEDVYFTNITGAARAETVASLVCSPDGRCGKIEINDFNISAGSGDAEFECINIAISGNAASLFPEDCRAA